MEEKKLMQLTKKVLIQMLLELEEKTKVVKHEGTFEKTAVEKPKLEVLFINIEEIVAFNKLTALRKKLKINLDRPSRTPDPNETQLLIEECVKGMAEKGFIYCGQIYISLAGTGGKLVFTKLI